MPRVGAYGNPGKFCIWRLAQPDSTEMGAYGVCGRIWFREMGNGGRNGNFWQKFLVELVKSGNRPLAAGQFFPFLAGNF